MCQDRRNQASPTRQYSFSLTVAYEIKLAYRKKTQFVRQVLIESK